MEKFRKQL